MITKDEIDAFLSIAQCGSISQAAQQLYITQPALSRRIKSIEADLECELFNRGRGARTVQLTSQGRAFLPIARKWLEVYAEALSVKDAFERPRLRVSAVGSVWSFLMPGILHDTTRDDAPYLMDFNLCHSAEAPGLVESGTSDVALLNLVRNPIHVGDSLVARPVYSVAFVLIGGSDWMGKASVAPAELDPRREVRVPWDYAFNVWHEKQFGDAVNPMIRIDDAASIGYVLRDDLFCIAPKTEAVRIAEARPDTALVELVDGPPDDIVHCLTPLARHADEKIAYFDEVLRRNVERATGIKVLF